MASGRFSKLEKSSEVVKRELAPPPGTVARTNPAAAVPPTEAAPARTTASEGDYPDFLLEADKAFFTGDFKTALRNYSRALQSNNAQVYPWIGQISSLIEQKQFREAEIWSNRALEQFPEESSLLSQRARVLAYTGNIKRAIGVSDFAMSKGATEWTWMARGEVLLQASDGNALFCFEKAIEAAGNEDWRIPLLAGRAYARRRQWSSAEEFLRRAVQVNAKNYFAWYEYAKVLAELNFLDRARDAITRVIQLKPDFREARQLEARLFRRPFLKRIFGILKR